MKSAAKPANTLRRDPAIRPHAARANARLSQDSRAATSAARPSSTERLSPSCGTPPAASSAGRRLATSAVPRPAAERLEDSPGGQSNLLDRDDVVEIIDRLRYQMDEPMADREPEQYAEPRSRRAERGRFAEDDRQDFAASCPDRPQNRDVASALDHGEADSAIDEQRADEQREQAHRREVGGEGSCHVERLVAPGRRPGRAALRPEARAAARRVRRGPRARAAS